MPEDDGGYEAYVKYLYETYVEPVASRHRSIKRHRLDWDDEFGYPLSILARADAMLRLITATPDVYETFRPRALETVIRETSSGVSANSRMLSELGFAEVLDSEYPILARGLRPEHLPPEEAELLRRVGFPEIADNLPGITYAVREHARASIGSYQEVPPSTEMRNLVERLAQAAQDHRRLCEIEEELVVLRRTQESDSGALQQLTDEATSKKKSGRWWKGIGQIVQGAGICLSDATVAVGLGTTIAPPAWIALTSVTIGVGTLMNGVGELRSQ